MAQQSPSSKASAANTPQRAAPMEQTDRAPLDTGNPQAHRRRQEPKAPASQKKERFGIQREHNGLGYQDYIITNKSNRTTLRVAWKHFDHFREHLAYLSQRLRTPADIEPTYLYRHGEPFIGFSVDRQEARIQIQLVGDPPAHRQLTLSIRSLDGLYQKTLSPKLGHTSARLKVLLSYHKCFQETFVEASDSFSGGLNLRKNHLTQIVDYQPPQDSPMALVPLSELLGTEGNTDGPATAKAKQKSGHGYQPAIGERIRTVDQKIDYQQVFGDHIKSPSRDKDEQKSSTA